MTRSAVLALFILAGISTSTFAQEKLPDAPIPAREAAARMTVPDGFKVTLFAGEPDVVQPIAFTFDDRGRLWVVENFSYPKWNKDIATEKGEGGRVLDKRKGKDRIVILEDTDGDGQHDKRTVFADNLTNLSGIEYGFGGVWLCSIPNLLYIPIKTGEDKPAGPPEIKLDGWSLQSGHNAFNGLKWGPDGWLYGCNGITATSQVGLPATPDKQRTPMNCGVWRYHPTKKKFEVFAHGTTNPWGLDWDEYGELFITNCVIDHVWHVVPGGHYERMYGQDFNPHLYKLMPSIADHKHWAGGSWTDSRGGKGAHSDAGGGHAHVGCMIYQGDNWPKQYRGGLFTLNLHGNRINHDLLERKGSSYVAKHGKDFLFANDPWFRGIGIDYGPDGGVYVSDWCDTGECHNYQVAHTTTGRIYKIVHGKPKVWRGDLAKLSNEELIVHQALNDVLQSEGCNNEWFRRHARRLLQERVAEKKLTVRESGLLRNLLRGPHLPWICHLRSLWLAHAIDEVLPDDLALFMIFEPTNELYHPLRSWSLRFAVEQLRDDYQLKKGRGVSITGEAIKNMAQKARPPRDPRDRMALASALQRLPPEVVVDVAGQLLKHAEDDSDPYLPLMIWYGIERMPTSSIPDSLELLRQAKFSLIRQLLARRIALLPSKENGIDSLVTVVRQTSDSEVQRDILSGLYESLKGQRSHTMPRGWDMTYPKLAASPSNDVRDRAMVLAVLFGDKRAIEALQILIGDATKPGSARKAALQALVGKQRPELVAVLHDLIDDTTMRPSAIQALAAYADPKTPSLILHRYAKLTSDEKSDAVHTLASRPAYALALLDAVADKTVARNDLNAFTVRQLLALNDKQVTKRVNEVWGALRPPSQEKAALMAKYKTLLTADTMKTANVGNGRLIYTKQCAACHKLFGEGGNIGPELTGSQRTNLDYVLENMLDPSAVVPREYQVQTIVTDSGRTITGIVKEETERALTIQTQNELIILPKSEIDSRRGSNLSMMPEGVLDRMSIEEIRDLAAYLASPMQTALPK